MGYHSKPNQYQRKSKYESWDGYIGGLTPLGHGVSGIVLAIDDQRVAKIDTGSLRSIEDIETERNAYRKLSIPGSPYVLRCYELDNPNGIVLERCKHTVRKLLQFHYNGKNPPESLVQNWVYEAVQGLAYVHRCGVIQGDVGCHNMLLSLKDETVKLADFSGSSVDGSPLAVDYETWSKLPGSDEPSQVADIFAMGSAIYEMATGSPPYEKKSWREVHGLFKRSKFPEVNGIRHLGPVIRKCWNQEYNTANEILDDLENNSKLCLRRMDSNTSEDSFEVEPSSSQKSGRQPGSKHKYVELAKNSRRNSRRQEVNNERILEKNRHRKDRRWKDETNCESFFTKSLNWLKPSYTYQIKI